MDNFCFRMVPSGMVCRSGSVTWIGSLKESKNAMFAIASFIRILVSYRNFRVRPAKRNSTAPVYIDGSVLATNPHVRFVEIYFRLEFFFISKATLLRIASQEMLLLHKLLHFTQSWKLNVQDHTSNSHGVGSTE